MLKAKLILDKDFTIAPIDKRIYGTFVEDIGRVVDGFVYAPEHPLADENGFRKDVKALLKELNTTMIRFPGGNATSGRNWRDAIGPREERPLRRLLDANIVTRNAVGVDEFADYCKEIGAQLMMAVNLGTGTPAEAADLIEYCNYEGDTELTRERRRNGHSEPHKIPVWCVGNEMDGDWQIGHLLPEEYARKAEETCKLMKWCDPSAQLVVVGSSSDGENYPTYPDWNRIVLERTYPYCDYISIHKYISYDPQVQMAVRHNNTVDDIAHFPIEIDNFIGAVSAAMDLAKTKFRGKKDIKISFDEWGIQSSHNVSPMGLDWPRRVDKFEFLESVFPETSVLDAMLYGCFLMSFINRADRVGAACESITVSSLINCRLDGTAWRNTCFYPFALTAKYGLGTALQQKIHVPEINTPGYGACPAVQTAAVWNEERSEAVIFAVNYHTTETIALEAELRAFGRTQLIEHIELWDAQPYVGNTREEPDRVVPHRVGPHKGQGDDFTLKPLSWNMLRFSVEK